MLTLLKIAATAALMTLGLVIIFFTPFATWVPIAAVAIVLLVARDGLALIGEVISGGLVDREVERARAGR